MTRINLSAWAVEHPTLVLYLIFALTATGLWSFLQLGRTEDPSFTIKAVNVTAYWPEAPAQEIRDQVADRIEKKVQTLPYFDHTQTYSKDGFLAMQVWLKDSTPPSQVPHLFYQLRKKIGDLSKEMPAGVAGPYVDDESGEVDSVLLAISGDGSNYAQLEHVADALRDRLLASSDTASVNVYGDQSRKVFIEFSEAKLASLGVTPTAIFDSLAKQNILPDVGAYETASIRVPIQIVGAPLDASTVGNVPFEIKGRSLRLSDIAEVKNGYQDPPRFLVRHKGKPAVVVGVVMTKGGNLNAFGQQIAEVLGEFRANAPVGVEIEQIADQPNVVMRAVGEFTKSFAEALAIVLAVSFVSLGFRPGVVVVVAVPLVLAIVFVGMKLMGIDLQRVSLGALIIALGLIVDDAIIAVEMMLVKIEQGVDRVKAACFAWDSTAFPMLTGTLITAAGFMPVGFAPSSTGEYTGSMFWVLLLALLASWIVAVVFTPFIGIKLLPRDNHEARADENVGYDTLAYRRLRSLISWSVDHRGAVVACTCAVFVLAAGGFLHVKQQFFPVSDRPELFLQLRLPEGSSINASVAAVKEAEKLLEKDPDAAQYTAYIGRGAPHFWLALNPALPNEAYSEIVIVPKDIPSRERVKARLEAAVANGALSGARARVVRFDFGPPVGFPVQFRVLGPDVGVLREIAYQLREIMRMDPSVVEPQLDWNEQALIARLLIDQDRARQLGLTPADVAARLRQLMSGDVVTHLRDGIHSVEVIARADVKERLDLSRLGELVVDAGKGQPVPVSQVATVVYAHRDPIYWQRNRALALTVRADVTDGAQGPDVSNRIWPRLQELRTHLPFGYKIEAGGAVEEAAKANASIATVFPVVLLVMSTIIIVQLQNFARFGLVLLSAPLGVIGASCALNLSGAPFGFVALLGMIALSGMDMRNSIILVDQVRQDLEKGESYREAIIGATVRRVRPVALTSLATVLAMVPLTGSAFWGPMALTIMGGLSVATFLTILFLPALYALWFRREIAA